MTLIIRPDRVEHTNSTQLIMNKSRIAVGKKLINNGTMDLHNTDLVVGEDFSQNGTLRVDDPRYFAQSVLEICKSTSNLTEIGKRFWNY